MSTLPTASLAPIACQVGTSSLSDPLGVALGLGWEPVVCSKPAAYTLVMLDLDPENISEPTEKVGLCADCYEAACGLLPWLPLDGAWSELARPNL